MQTITFSRFKEPDELDAKVIAECACGCGEEIVEGYRHLEFDGDWFYDAKCFAKYMNAEWRNAG